jgi:hypothetical protein
MEGKSNISSQTKIKQKNSKSSKKKELKPTIILKISNNYRGYFFKLIF